MKICYYILALVVPIPLFAGGGPLNTLVVANASSQDSLEVAQYYQSVRGLPPMNLCIINTTTNALISYSEYKAEIEEPVLDWIQEQGLEQQIHFIALSRDLPYRVQLLDGPTNSINGITSALFYGFKVYPSSPVCQLPVGTTNDFFAAEIAYEYSESWMTSNSNPIVTILSGWTKQDSKDLINRSLIADGSFPSGRARYIRSLDPFRNVRWPQHEESDYQTRFQTSQSRPLFKTGNGLINELNVTGVAIGISQVSPMSVFTSYEPGAYADHLTSFGGDLFQTFTGQMSILDWLFVGASGSYGTVVEPCNFIQKFPRIRLHNWSGMGFNLAESYMMSLEVPYMGVIVGDPLTQPYAQLPTGQITSPTNGQVVSGATLIEWNAEAVDAVRVGRVDGYINGRLSTQLFEAATSTGMSYTVSLGTNVLVGVIDSGLTLQQALFDIGGHINASNSEFTATSRPGRIQLFQNALRTPASNEVISLSVTDPENVFHLQSQTPHFLESEYDARMLIGIKGTPETGDVVRAVVTRLDGVKVTNTVSSLSTNDTAKSLTIDLYTAMGNDLDLTGPDGCTVDDFQFNTTYAPQNLGLIYLLANTVGWTGSNLRVDFDVISSTLDDTSVDTFFNHNESVMSGRGEFQSALGPTSLVSSFVWDTTTLPNGPHEFQLSVSSGRAEAAQHLETIQLWVSNSAFQVTIESPDPLAEFLLGADVTGQVVATGGMVSNLSLLAEGVEIAAGVSSNVAFSFSTLDFGVGEVVLQARAQSTGGEEALSEKIKIQILENDDIDFDQLADAWEVLHFGSTTNYSGVDDPDDDGQSNRFEFCAGTQPTNENHYFAFTTMSSTGGMFEAEYYSGSGSVYRLEKTMGSGLNPPISWQSVDTVTAQSVVSQWIYPLSGSDSNDVFRINITCPPLITD